jgi:hypothetical protein
MMMQPTIPVMVRVIQGGERQQGKRRSGAA